MQIIRIGAIWCSGCLIVDKSLKKLSEEEKVDIKYLDLDFDEEVEKYQIADKLPVIIFMKDNQEVNRLIGEKNYDEIKKTYQNSI